MTDILSGPRKDAQTRNLISELRTAENKADRTRALERVTMLHLPLARSLAHRYSGKGLDREDLEQVAFLALLKAIQRFDLSKPTEFGAYATPTITGELRGTSVTTGGSSARRGSCRSAASSSPTRGHGSSSSSGTTRAVDEIADELELTHRVGARGTGRREQPASRLARRDDGRRQPTGARPLRRNARGSSDPALDEGIVVRTALERLPARDQRIVELRFTNDLTQAEIAQSMGLSAMQVSRLLRRTLDTLRSTLDAEGIRSA